MNALWKVLRYLKPYRWMVVAGILATALAVPLDLAVPRLAQRAIDQGIRVGNTQVVLTSALLMVAFAVLRVLFATITGVFAARSSQGFGYDLRHTLFARIQTLSYPELDHMQTGQLMVRVTSDVEMVRMLVSMSMRMLTRAPLMVIGSVIMIYLTKPSLAYIILGIMVAMLGFMAIFAGKVRPLFKRIQEKLGALNTVLQENLAGVKVVRAFVRAHFERQRFAGRNQDLYQQAVRAGLMMSIAFPVLFLLMNTASLLVLWLGGSEVIANQLTVGELVAFNNYVLTTMFPLLMLSTMIAFISGAAASAERIKEILDIPVSVQEPAQPKRLPAIQGRVAFEHVFFRYNGSGSEDVLQDISFVVEPGETVAIVGATGAGKSTLVYLIPRFYDVTAGRVTIDGVDVREVSFDDLRRQISIAPQEIVLFEGTIRDNIAFGRPDATDEEIIAAAKAAQAHDFIMAMPDGYNSWVEARGRNLSGGQRQRIAIARALVMNPSILILDDSTSSVDMETEYKIQQALEEIRRGRTNFIIAQRISSVLHADKIIVLERGRVVGIGTHLSLLATNPVYQDIYYSQMHADAEQAEFEVAAPAAGDPRAADTIARS